MQKLAGSEKDEVNLEIYDVTGWLTITIHILPNILQIKASTQ